MAKLPSIDTYCLCSEMSYAEIIEQQRAAPLPFDDFIAAYTKCNDGCGGCVDKLEQLLAAIGLLNAAGHEGEGNRTANIGEFP